MPRTRNGMSRVAAELAAAVLAAGVALTACSGQPADQDAGSAASPGGGGQSGAAPSSPEPDSRAAPSIRRFDVPAGAGPHDVAPAADGGVWFTAQHAGYLGHLDPD